MKRFLTHFSSLIFVIIASSLIAACSSDEGDSDSTSSLSEATLTFELATVGKTAAVFSCYSSTADKSSYFVFVSEDVDTAPSSLVSSYLASNSSITTYSGRNRITISDLGRATEYIAVMAGYYDGSTYGTPLSVIFSTEELSEASFTLSLTDYSPRSVTVTVVPSSAERETYSIFITDDLDSEVSEIVTSYVADTETIETLSGENEVTFSDLIGGATYRVVVFGFDDEVYGDPVELEVVAPTEDISSWSVSYLGKTYDSSLDSYLDEIQYTDGNGGNYVPAVYAASDVEGMSDEEIASTFASDLKSYIQSYEDEGEDYLSTHLYTESTTLLYSGLSEDSEYYAYMFDVDEDGNVSGQFVSEKFTPETVDVSTGYEDWLGLWYYSAACEDGSTWTAWLNFEENVRDESMYMSQCEGAAYMPDEPMYADVTYDSETGEIYIYATNTGVQAYSNTYGYYTYYFQGGVYINEKQYNLAGTGYAISKGYFTDESCDYATLTGEPCTVTSASSGAEETVTPNRMGYIGRLDSGSTAVTFTPAYAPKMYFDISLQRTSFSSSGSESAANKSLYSISTVEDSHTVSYGIGVPKLSKSRSCYIDFKAVR